MNSYHRNNRLLDEKSNVEGKENYPAETRIMSGLNLCAHGTMTSSNTVRMAISPEPPGKGRFSVAPSPFPLPI